MGDRTYGILGADSQKGEVVEDLNESLKSADGLNLEKIKFRIERASTNEKAYGVILAQGDAPKMVLAIEAYRRLVENLEMEIHDRELGDESVKSITHDLIEENAELREFGYQDQRHDFICASLTGYRASGRLLKSDEIKSLAEADADAMMLESDSEEED